MLSLLAPGSGVCSGPTGSGAHYDAGATMRARAVTATDRTHQVSSAASGSMSHMCSPSHRGTRRGAGSPGSRTRPKRRSAP